MTEIIYKLIEQPKYPTVFELQKMPLSEMREKMDWMEADNKRLECVERDRECQDLIMKMRAGASLKAKINQKRNHYFIGEFRAKSSAVKKLFEKGFIRGN